MNKLILQYLIVPPILLLSIGTSFHVIGYIQYLPQFVIASGTICSAFIALYISKTGFEKENNFNNLNAKNQLEHFITIIEEGSKAAKNEVNNYKDFILEIDTKGLEQTILGSTSFYFFEKASVIETGSFYNSLLKNPKNNEASFLRNSYLEIANQIQICIFLKNNGLSQYENFINTYNVHASKWTTIQNKINEIYLKAKLEPFDEQSDFRLLKIIDGYSGKLRAKEISYYNIEDINQNLIIPLSELINWELFTSPYTFKLEANLSEAKVAFDKIEEIQNITKEHFQNLQRELESSLLVIDRNILIIKQELV